ALPTSHDRRLWSYRSGIRTSASTNGDHGGGSARRPRLTAPFADPERHIGDRCAAAAAVNKESVKGNPSPGFMAVAGGGSWPWTSQRCSRSSKGINVPPDCKIVRRGSTKITESGQGSLDCKIETACSRTRSAKVLRFHALGGPNRMKT